MAFSSRPPSRRSPGRGCRSGPFARPRTWRWPGTAAGPRASRSRASRCALQKGGSGAQGGWAPETELCLGWGWGWGWGWGAFCLCPSTLLARSLGVLVCLGPREVWFEQLGLSRPSKQNSSGVSSNGKPNGGSGFRAGARALGLGGQGARLDFGPPPAPSPPRSPPAAPAPPSPPRLAGGGGRGRGRGGVPSAEVEGPEAARGVPQTRRSRAPSCGRRSQRARAPRRAPPSGSPRSPSPSAAPSSPFASGSRGRRASPAVPTTSLRSEGRWCWRLLRR